MRSRPRAGWLLLAGVTTLWGVGCSVQRVGVRDPAARPAGNAPYDPQAERASPPAPTVAAKPATGSEAEPPTLDTPQAVDFGSPRVQVEDLAVPQAPASQPSAERQSGDADPTSASSTGASGPTSAASDQAPAGAAAYRVQVFAGTDAAMAESVRADVASRLGEPAVVVYQAPYYKVRVGDCPTSDRCTDLQARLRSAGFTTTWVVADGSR